MTGSAGLASLDLSLFGETLVVAGVHDALTRSHRSDQPMHCELC